MYLQIKNGVASTSEFVQLVLFPLINPSSSVCADQKEGQKFRFNKDLNKGSTFLKVSVFNTALKPHFTKSSLVVDSCP